MADNRLVFRVHALQRMVQRHVTEDAVRDVLAHGKVIEDYPNDTPFSSRLILGWYAGRPLHIVAADDSAARETIIITVYEPDPSRWTPDFTRRLP